MFCKHMAQPRHPKFVCITHHASEKSYSSLVFLFSGPRTKLCTRLLLHQFWKTLLSESNKLMQKKSHMKLYTRLHWLERLGFRNFFHENLIQKTCFQSKYLIMFSLRVWVWDDIKIQHGIALLDKQNPAMYVKWKDFNFLQLIWDHIEW